MHNDIMVDLPEHFARLAPKLDKLAAEAADRIRGCDETDPIFGHYSAVASYVRGAVTAEGLLIEQTLRLAIASAGGYRVMEPDFTLPLTREALAALARNEGQKLRAIRFDHRSEAAGRYRPDVVAVHVRSQTAVVLEVKRATASFSRPILRDAVRKLTASALVLRSALEARPAGLVVTRIKPAILDAADSDSRKDVLALADLDRVLGTEGVADCVGYTRQRFGRHVRAALDRLHEGKVTSITSRQLPHDVFSDDVDEPGDEAGFDEDDFAIEFAEAGGAFRPVFA